MNNNFREDYHRFNSDINERLKGGICQQLYYGLEQL